MPGATPLTANASVGLGLGLVHGGVGGGVDDQVRPHLRTHATIASGSARSSCRAIRRDHLAERGQAARQFEADLAVPAGEEDLHATSGSVVDLRVRKQPPARVLRREHRLARQRPVDGERRDRSRAACARARAPSSRWSCRGTRRTRRARRSRARSPAGSRASAAVLGGQHDADPAPEGGGLRRRSTATSNTSPAITRTSLPCGCSIW